MKSFCTVSAAAVSDLPASNADAASADDGAAFAHDADAYL